ncbi:MAG: 4-(cytidine 5'-diphospho)-2-C-methyl-D-erythritol kinase [Simkaniaceae bacterium]|nr:4-(cytidine 5'-diphospho)-2-C-methyl-D-erythritol kinase [Simkaniaceae bacterium]
MLNNSVVLFSPAKLNLFFRVLTRRDDGYHDVATVMQALSFGDKIRIDRGGDGDEDLLTGTGPAVLLDRTNLAMRALTLFRERGGEHFPVRIHIDKKIPPGGGFGGGSSNAATVLKGLSLLADCPLPEEELAEWSGSLSSDAPFFFSSGTARCTGRGEQVEEAGDLRSRPSFLRTVWLILSEEGLSTVAVYRGVTPRPGVNPLASPIGVNDLEESAFRLKPSLRTLKEELLAGGLRGVAMTGSGSALFAPRLPEESVPPLREGSPLVEKLRTGRIRIIPAHGIFRSRPEWYRVV